MVKGLVKFETACTMVERPSMLTQAPSNCSNGDYSPVTWLVYQARFSEPRDVCLNVSIESAGTWHHQHDRPLLVGGHSQNGARGGLSHSNFAGL